MATLLRYAIAIAPSFEAAERIVRALGASGIAGERIAILGQRGHFTAQMRHDLLDGAAGQTWPVESPSQRVVSLGRIERRLVPEFGMRDAVHLDETLSLWLTPAHAKRLSKAVADGGFLVWVELIAANEENMVTRCLLRSSPKGVAVHDFIFPTYE